MDLSHFEIRALLEGILNEGRSDELQSIWVKDVFSDTFVYEDEGEMFRSTYTINEDGTVSTGEAERVKISYEKFSELKGIEILKTGSFKSMFGKTVTFTAEDLQNIASKFEELKETVKPPLSISHAEGNESALINALTVGSPVAGYLSSVKKVGDTLIADVIDIPVKAAEMIGKQLKRVSAEVYNNFKDSDDHTHGMVLRRLSFVDSSAIKELADVTEEHLAFGDMPDQLTTFVMLNEHGVSEETNEEEESIMTEAEILAMKEENARLKAEAEKTKADGDDAASKLSEYKKKTKADGIKAFIDSMVKAGKVAPAGAPGLQKLMEGLSDDEADVSKFGEGEAAKDMTPLGYMKSTIEASAQVVKFGELAEGSEGDDVTSLSESDAEVADMLGVSAEDIQKFG